MRLLNALNVNYHNKMLNTWEKLLWGEGVGGTNDNIDEQGSAFTFGAHFDVSTLHGHILASRTL